MGPIPGNAIWNFRWKPEPEFKYENAVVGGTASGTLSHALIAKSGDLLRLMCPAARPAIPLRLGGVMLSVSCIMPVPEPRKI